MSKAEDTIHFIYPVTDRTRPWSFINHVTLLLARKVHNPQKIIIWSNKPEASPSMLETARAVDAEVRTTAMPTQFGGGPIIWPQYMSDVLRLRILLEHGGIYMDTDMLLLKPLHEHLSDKLVISWESQAQCSISNALMISPPQNKFLRTWLKNLEKVIQSDVWAYGGVVLPAKMIAEEPSLEPYRTVLPHNFCCPLDLTREWLTTRRWADSAEALAKDSSAIHVFETYWAPQIKNVDREFVKNNDTMFSRIVNKYLNGDANA